MEFDFTNDNTQTAYIAFGDAVPTGSYVVPEGVTVYNNGTVAATGETISLSQSTVFELTSGQAISGVDVSDFQSGKFLVSFGQTLTSLDNTEFNQGAGGDSTTRWDKIEASIYPANSGQNNALDLTAADFTSIGFKVQDLTNPSDDSLQTSTVPMVQAFESIANAALINGTVTNAGTVYNDYAVITGSDGVYVPQFGTDVLRIISPSTVPQPGTSAYNNLDAYIASAETAMGTITVSGEYDLSGSTPATETQAYSFTTAFDNAGDLIMVSNSVASNGIPAGQTIEITAAEMPTAVTGDNPSYTVDGVAANIGNNDVYAAAVRDILGGFAFGFVDSSEVIPGTTLTFAQAAQDPSVGTADWYGAQVTTAAAFANAQPDQPTFYNQYAAAIASLGDAYGFPFSDLIVNGPQLDPQSTDTVAITIQSDSVACFVQGTGIATAAGAVAVEDLVIGDRVLTVDGTEDTIRWIGRRTVDCTRHPKPEQVWPVRVAAGAFAPQLPVRDLFLSPDHAIYAEGVLVPIKHLINGHTVAQQRPAAVTYFHVELARHNVLLAEGLPAESYLDTGDRDAFANGGGATRLHPAWGSAARDIALFLEVCGFAPLTVAGPAVERLRARLAGKDGLEAA
jgi:hypothetical protein